MRSRQRAGSGWAGSVTASLPRGAPASVKTYSRPSRPTCSPVRASTPSCTTWSSGAAVPEAARSASHTSLRGAVPWAAEITSQRPSRLTETP